MRTVIRNGNVWNGESFVHKDIAFEGRFFTEIPAHPDREVDAAGMYIVPGIINTSANLSARSTGDYAHVFINLSPEESTVTSIKSMSEHLRNGVTTVRDCGCRYNESIVLRDAVERGDLIGPSIVAAGKMVLAPGGHWAGTLVTGKVEARKAAAQLWAEGADFFKLGVSGGVGGDRESPDSLELGEEEVQVFCDFAKDHNMKVVCHTHGARSMRVALAAGADALMHCTFAPDDVVEQIVEKGVYVTPTLAAYENIAKYGIEGGWSPRVVEMVRDYVLPAKRVSISKLIRAGAKIAFGTMAGGFHITPFDVVDELRYMEQLGMSTARIIRSCTVTAAEVCGIQHVAGSVEPGKWADFLILKSNPLHSVEAYGEISKVFKFGREIFLDREIQQ